MNKTFKQTLALALCLAASTPSLLAYDVEIDGIYYNLFPNQQIAEVTYNEGYNSYSGDVIIPSTISCAGIEFTVARIGEKAFRYCWHLNSVHIPNSVEIIENQAFLWCEALLSVKMPNNLISIGESAFDGCDILFSIEIPNGVERIDNEAFYNCSSLISIEIPNSVTEMGNRVFRGCSNLSSVKISNSLTEISDDTFYNCCSLTSVVIPSSVKKIGSGAFYGCSSLSSIGISNGVERIEAGAFYNCGSLTSVVIPNSVTTIGTQAFSKCTNLKTVCFLGNPDLGEQNYYDYTLYDRIFANCPNIDDFYCMADSAKCANENLFEQSNITNSTLHVPAGSIEQYRTTVPWNQFGTIVTLDGTEIPDTPECAAPIVTYEDGELHFACETEGVTFISEVTSEDMGRRYDAAVPLTATYSISVYATRSGYTDSERVTATLCWLDENPGGGTVSAPIQVAATPVLLTRQGDVLTISGAPEGTRIALHTVDGRLVATVTATAGTPIRLNVTAGQTYVVTVGRQTFKVRM